MALTLKTASQYLHLTMMHHHTKFGYKRLNSSEGILWTKPGPMERPTGQTWWFHYTPLTLLQGVYNRNKPKPQNAVWSLTSLTPCDLDKVKIVSNWMLMTCQPHRMTKLRHKQNWVQISKLRWKKLFQTKAGMNGWSSVKGIIMQRPKDSKTVFWEKLLITYIALFSAL